MMIPFDLMNQRSKKFVPNYIIHKSFAGIFLDKNSEEYNIRAVGAGAEYLTLPQSRGQITYAHQITARQLPPDFQTFLVPTAINMD